MVWRASAPAAQQYLAFRGETAALTAAPRSALLHIFADARYVAWVNGVYIARGPCRFNPKAPEYDSLDVARYLTAGVNSVVVLVHNYGPGAINGRIMYHTPGLTALLVADGVPIASTDAQWRVSNATEYTASPIAWSSIPDVLDLAARDALGPWTSPSYDDSAWERAAAIDGSTWGPLTPRALPLPRETAVAGLTLAASGAPLAFPLTVTPGTPVLVNIGAMTMAYADVELLGTSPAAAAAAAPFHAAPPSSSFHIEFALRYTNGAPSETYGVGMTVALGAGAAPQHALGGDQWCAHYMILTATGAPVVVANLTLVSRAYPFVRLGAFNASGDALLTEVWRRAVNTIAAVTDDGYGSDARERNEWLQDPAEPNFITTRVAFAAADGTLSDPRPLRNILRHAALSQLADGRILSTFPTDRGPSDCHYSVRLVASTAVVRRPL